MSIKSQGGVFGRNPTFNDVTVEGDLSIDGTLSVGGETITGLSYQGGWNASTNSPDIAASSPVTGQFWIVSADGSTNVGGITNWTQGDWALYDGTNWQRVEGGNTDLSTGVQGQLAVANGGTGAADASTARTNLGLGSAATSASTDFATAAQGSLADSAVQTETDPVVGAVTGIVKADGAGNISAATASTDYVVPSDISNMLETTDIGSTVQAYDADTAKLDTAQTWTANQSFADNAYIKLGASDDLRIFHDGSNSYIQEFGTGNLILGASASFQIKSSDNVATGAVFNGYGSVELNHNGSKKIETTSTGVSVTGNTVASSGVQGATVTSTGKIRANNGVFSSNTKTTTISAINTWTNLGVGTVGGLFVFRDGSAGGTAVFRADTSAGATSISNGIGGGFNMRYSGGDMQIQTTSVAPKTIRWVCLLSNEV